MLPRCAVFLATLFSVASAVQMSPNVTVSGLSAGAFFAVQYHFAFSSEVSGAAVFAGGPYYCSKGEVINAINACMSTPLLINDYTLEKAARSFASEGSIDETRNVSGSRVYIYSGKKDTVVKNGVVEKASTLYGMFGADIKNELSVDSEHGQPTLDYGEECASLGSPFILKCGFDGAGEALGHLLGPDGLTEPRGVYNPDNIVKIDQRGFIPSGRPDTSIADTAYAYVPTACRGSDISFPGDGDGDGDGDSNRRGVEAPAGVGPNVSNGTAVTCRLHISFHGCEQTVGDIGTAYVEHAGYNEWAESNNIIVLYPQVKSDFLSNPKGCFNWWGYGGDKDFANRNGGQMATVRAMARSFFKQ